MTALSKVEICNLALARLGQNTIQSLSEASNAAYHCNTLYDPNRRSVLRRHPWGFAQKTQALSVDATTPDDYSYRFLLPADFIRLMALVGTTTAPDYEKRGSYLLTNESEVTIRYVYDVEDTSEFDDEFVSAFAYLLASELAIPITGDAARQQTLYAKYIMALTDAEQTNKSEPRKTVNRWTTYIDARN